MSRARILIVEDDEAIQVLDRILFEREQFDVTILDSGEEALETARRIKPHLVVLDRHLPGIDGIEVCKRMRADPELSTIGIVMVTVRDQVADTVLALEVGADDYIAKPFAPDELVARVRAVLRRQEREPAASSERITRGGVTIDIGSRMVYANDTPIDLTSTQFDLLVALAKSPGRVFTRNQLIDKIRGGEAVVTDRTVDQHIRAVRERLGEARDAVETVRGVGYRFRVDE
jgi:DNA-binding response OmpR family regulator